MEKIRRFLNDEEGVTAIEYGLIAAIIAVAIVGGVTTIGTNLKQYFHHCLREADSCWLKAE